MQDKEMSASCWREKGAEADSCAFHSSLYEKERNHLAAPTELSSLILQRNLDIRGQKELVTSD